MAKTWFITGTSSGLGYALATELLDRGDRVAATVRRRGSMDELKAQHGDRLWVATLDVTDADAIRDVVARAFIDLGSIDVVVNNAGYGLAGTAEELSDAQIRHQIDTNLVGSIQVTRAAIPFLRDQGGGRIIQIASMGAHVAFPLMSIYHATKWAVEGFVEAVAQEVGTFGIEFTMVEPGMARTNFGASGMVAAEPMAVYQATPAGDFRRAFAAGMVPNNGDPRKMAQAIVDSSYCRPAPRRLALGSDAYAMIREALASRIDALDAQRAIALSTNVDEDVSAETRDLVHA